MSFLQPTYLWGLFSLVVPLVIHLLNKGDVKTIKVGSVRYLTAQETTQTRQLKLNELLLLLLRMLLLTLLVLAIAEPILKSQKKNVPLTYLIEPSLLQNGQMDDFLNENKDVPLRFFSKDFPNIDRGNVPKEVSNYWQLAQELQNLESDSIVVFSKASMVGIQGMRPVTAKNISWISIDEVAVIDSLVGATTTKSGVTLHTIKSDGNYTDIQNTFSSEEEITSRSGDSISLKQNGVIKNIPLRLQDTLRIGVYYDIEFLKEKNLFAAAFKAVSKYTQSHLILEELLDTEKLSTATFDLTVWLDKSPPPKIKGRLVYYEPDSLATNSIKKTAQKNVFCLTERLTIDRVLNERLTAELLQIVSTRSHLERAMRSLDKRTLAAQEFLPSTTNFDYKGNEQKRSIVNWFWIAAVLVLVMERLIAKFRKQ